MASAGRWDRQFMVTLYTLVALAGLVLGGWVTLGRFGIPLGTYCIVAVIALAYGFSTSWFGAGYRGVAVGGFVGIFVVFWYLSAAQDDFGVLQYAWILSALAGSVLARKEFPGGVQSAANEATRPGGKATFDNLRQSFAGGLLTGAKGPTNPVHVGG